MNWVLINSDHQPLPHANTADSEGLVAIGGKLTPTRLEEAYRKGIFPWFTEDQPVMWWSPDPRMILYPAEIKVQKSMRPLLNRNAFRVSMNTAFEQVIDHCANLHRPGQDGTWITSEVRDAYVEWHRLGRVHSFEAWDQNELVGGFYGVQIGGVFFGESMFSLRPNASKYAFIQGVRWMKSRGIRLIDCQMETDHLKSLGATVISRVEFLEIIGECIEVELDFPKSMKSLEANESN